MDFNLFTGRNTQISSMLTMFAGLSQSWANTPFSQKLGILIMLGGLLVSIIIGIFTVIYKAKKHRLDVAETEARIKLLEMEQKKHE